MLSVEAAFDRISSALRQMGYAVAKDERPSDSPEDRLADFSAPNMSVRISWRSKARLLILQVKAGSEWAEFARRSFGPNGLEETTVDALVRSVRSEVAETSTDPG